ncbi:MAG: hypothetical protein ACP6IT_04115, partial [Candidatus Thorarchaeota archaeon]
AQYLGDLLGLDRRVTTLVYATPVFIFPTAAGYTYSTGAIDVLAISLIIPVLVIAALYGFAIIRQSPLRFTRKGYLYVVHVQSAGLLLLGIGGAIFLMQMVLVGSHLMTMGALTVMAGGFVREVYTKALDEEKEQKIAIIVNQDMAAVMTTLTGQIEYQDEREPVRIAQRIVEQNRGLIEQVFDTAEERAMSGVTVPDISHERIFRIEVRPNIWSSGQVSSVIVILTDITETAREIEAAQLADLLDAIVAERDNARFYLDLLTHDMANRLQVVLSGLEAMENDAGLPERLVDTLRIVMENVQESIRVISDARRVATMAKNRRSLEKVNLKTAVERAVLALNKRLRRVAPEIFADIPADIEVRADAMLNVCIETLVRICASMQECESPEIRILLAAQNDQVVELAIGDFIAHVPLDMREDLASGRIKSMFPQAEAGLALATEIMRYYGGSIRVEDVNDEDDERLRFVVTLQKYN